MPSNNNKNNQQNDHTPLLSNMTKKQDRQSYGGTHHSVATDDGKNDEDYYNQTKDDDGDIDVPLKEQSTTMIVGTSEEQESQGQQQQRPVLPFAVYLYAFCAALNSCNLGYDIGVSTNAGPLIQNDFNLSDQQLELFLGSINFWSIFGALLSPVITDQCGRRTTFCIAALGFCIGISVMATAQSFEVLMAARAVVGIGVGVGEAIDPMYISEMAPPSHRGELVSWAEAGVSLGVVLGFMSSLFFWGMNDNPGQQWRYMVGLGAVMPVVMLFLVVFVMPESPRWLLTRTSNRAQCTKEAREILERTYPVGTDVDEVMEDIQESLAIEEAASKVVGWKSLLCYPSPAIRRMLVVGVGIAIIQQAVGIDSVMFYLVFVIRQSGIRSEAGQLVALIILGTVKLIFVFVGAKLFDRVGRRIMLFISLIGCAASLVTVSFTFGGEDSRLSSVVCILGLASYLAFFSIGLGPGNWVVVSEVFATSIRAKAMSVAVFPNRVTATIMASSFLSMSRLLTWPGFFLLLAGICLASCLFLYIYLPETKGKSLEQMAVYFAEITGDRSILDAEEKLGKKRAMLKLNAATGGDSLEQNDPVEKPTGTMA